jgi:hypothetical protein
VRTSGAEREFMLREENRRLREQLEAAMDCMNYAWTIICNVSEGDWTKQNQEWQDAAARCRDQYHALLDSLKKDSPPASEPKT